MGVTGTWCQLCGLPVQKDHYVRDPHSPMMKIWRPPTGGHEWAPGERPVVFTKENDWLENCVGISRDETPQVIFGTPQDGTIDSADGKHLFVWNGDDEGYTFHTYCWERLGKPAPVAPTQLANGTHAFSQLHPYQQQLFDLRSFIDDGKGWALCDPSHDTPDGLKSRARIDEMVKALEHGAPVYERHASLTELLNKDRMWKGLTTYGRDDQRAYQVRYRHDLTPELDVSAYPHLIFLMKEYDRDPHGMPRPVDLEHLESFERRLKAAVEADQSAILVLVTVGDGQGQYLVYAKDEAATMKRIESLPGKDDPKPADFDNAHEPTWKTFFEDMNPRHFRQ